MCSYLYYPALLLRRLPVGTAHRGITVPSASGDLSARPRQEGVIGVEDSTPKRSQIEHKMGRIQSTA